MLLCGVLLAIASLLLSLMTVVSICVDSASRPNVLSVVGLIPHWSTIGMVYKMQSLSVKYVCI